MGKFDSYAAASPLTGTEETVLKQGSVTVETTVADIASKVLGVTMAQLTQVVSAIDGSNGPQRLDAGDLGEMLVDGVSKSVAMSDFDAYFAGLDASRAVAANTTILSTDHVITSTATTLITVTCPNIPDSDLPRGRVLCIPVGIGGRIKFIGGASAVVLVSDEVRAFSRAQYSHIYAVPAFNFAGTTCWLITGDTEMPIYAHARSGLLKPTVAKYETFDAHSASPVNLAGILTTQVLEMVTIALPGGVPITSISFLSGTTAASVPTNWWFVLLDSARVPLRLTADQTTTAWAANTWKTLNLTSSFETTYQGAHYLGIMMKATTPISLVGNAHVNTGITGLAPIRCGASSTGLTTPASLGAGASTAITPFAGVPYAYVS